MADMELMTASSIEMPVDTVLFMDAEDCFALGLNYSAGVDGAVDLVQAHKWFNLAATRGHRDAKLCRQEMAEMMSQGEVIKAQKAAREWMKKAN
jgi:TPR repeat protein